MGRTISIFAGDLRFLGDSENLQINGAQLLTAEILRRLVSQPWFDALEVFIPPSEMVQEEKLAQVALNFLPRERRGQGVLRFYPLMRGVAAHRQPRIRHASSRW